MMNQDGAIKDVFLAGLRNAHAVENEAVSLINRQLERLENYPEATERLQQHLSETHAQIDRLEAILDSIGDSPSMAKDTVAKLMANMAALGHTMAGDEILKNTFANYAFENYEIAAYKSLITIAEAGGFTSAVPALQQTLQEEEAMADWINKHIAGTTTRFLTLKQSGAQAHR
ncbi:ferritin-like domain-containing protein [Rhodoligotrophos defluvii]|uniref:ferritin-like domain-containing protein n=1 Tax=Rhodoligotrophos defluvii TaxID=2561934 RepID=UPI001EF02A35|nr:ferritin-like domain-containing protein [Rhodoligotrophos defluvii]